MAGTILITVEVMLQVFFLSAGRGYHRHRRICLQMNGCRPAGSNRCFFNSGKSRVILSMIFPNGSCFNLKFGRLIGEFSKRCWNNYCCHYMD